MATETAEESNTADASIDAPACEVEALLQNCSLPADTLASWLTLDDAVADAVPPVGCQRPTDEQMARLQSARVACDQFVDNLAPEAQEELRQLADARRRERKKQRQIAEKQEKKVRKKAAKQQTQAASSSGGYGPNGTRFGERMETRPPTVLDDMPAPASDNPLCTPAVEAAHVHRVYDCIADHWSHTRYKAWPKVDAFIRSFSPGSLIADLGAGNGKNLPAIKESGCYGVASDMSEPLCRIASETFGSDCAVADCLFTNFRTASFDGAISIAVLHHLSTEARRVQALREAARILRPGGEFLVYCWSYEQDDERSKSHHRFPGQDVLVPWSFRTPGVKKKEDNATDTADTSPDATAKGASPSAGAQHCANEEADNSQPWDEKPEVFQRYCHVYREGELLELFTQVPEFEVVDSWFDSGNWCAVGRRGA